MFPLTQPIILALISHLPFLMTLQLLMAFPLTQPIPLLLALVRHRTFLINQLSLLVLHPPTLMNRQSILHHQRISQHHHLFLLLLFLILPYLPLLPLLRACRRLGLVILLLSEEGLPAAVLELHAVLMVNVWLVELLRGYKANGNGLSLSGCSKT